MSKEKICIIDGSEIDFRLEVKESAIDEKCQDIWDYPNKYCKYSNGSEEAYYNFLKFLWVTFDDGREVRLTDIAKT